MSCAVGSKKRVRRELDEMDWNFCRGAPGGGVCAPERDGRRAPRCALYGALRLALLASRHVEGWGGGAGCAACGTGWGNAIPSARSLVGTAARAGVRQFYLTAVPSPGWRYREALRRLPRTSRFPDDLCARGAPHGRVANEVKCKR